jgi:hypothetical protein
MIRLLHASDSTTAANIITTAANVPINLFIYYILSVFTILAPNYKYKNFMRYAIVCFLTAAALLCCNMANAQDPMEKSPEEMAIEQANRLENELNLNSTQLFYLDSILRHNYTELYAEIENARARGSQDQQTYKTLTEKWMQKTFDALKGVLDEQQYIRYLKLMGKGKEYKKGKDGLYYLKEDLKKKKK